MQFQTTGVKTVQQPRPRLMRAHATEFKSFCVLVLFSLGYGEELGVEEPLGTGHNAAGLWELVWRASEHHRLALIMCNLKSICCTGETKDIPRVVVKTKATPTFLI